MSDSLNKTNNSTSKIVNKANIKVINTLSNPYIKYIFLIIIILQIIYIDKISVQLLEVFNYGIVKIIYALLIAYSACFDPVYAIALTTLIIICIQELYLRNAKKNIIRNTYLNTSSSNTIPSNVMLSNKTTSTNSAATQPAATQPAATQPTATQPAATQPAAQQTAATQTIIQLSPSKTLLLESNNDFTYADLQIKHNNIFNLINEHTIQRTPTQNDNLINNYEINNTQENKTIDPAFTTLTNNIQTKSYLNKNYLSITNQDLSDIQTNQQQLNDKQEQNLAQISFPEGYDTDTYLSQGNRYTL